MVRKLRLFFFLFGRRRTSRERRVSDSDRNRVLKQVLEEIKRTTEIRQEFEKKFEEVSNISTKFKEIETKVSDITFRVDKLEKRLDDTNKKLDKISKGLEQLLSIYELAVSKVNPFIEEGIEEIKLPEKEKSSSLLVQEKPSEELSKEEKIEKIVSKDLEKIKKEFEGEEKEMRKYLEEDMLNKIIPLTKLDKDYISLTTALTWLGYLVERLGSEGTVNLLKFYVDIGWINSNVFAELVKLVKGIKRMATSQPLEKPEIKDHLISIYFIAKLKGIKVKEDYQKLVMDLLKSEDLKDILNYKYPGE